MTVALLKRRRHLIALAALVLAPAACYHRTPPRLGASGGPFPSPAAGTWVSAAETGQNGASPGRGATELSLSANGKGFLKLAGAKETPIAWQQDGRKLIIETRGVERGRPVDVPATELRWVATASRDWKTLTLDVGDSKVTLKRP